MKLIPSGLPQSLRPCVSRLARVVCTTAVDELGLADAVVDQVGLSIESFPPHVRLGLVTALTLVEHGARLYPPARGRVFSACDPAVQDAYFKSLWHTPLPPVKQLVKGVKGLVALAFWDHPDVRRRMGFRPDEWASFVNARRLERYADDIAAHDRLVLTPNPLHLRTGAHR